MVTLGLGPYSKSVLCSGFSQGCGPGPSSPAAQTRGPPVGEPPDDAPPTVSFVDPAPGVYDGP